MTRRLAAILAADVVGYSALLREDEEGVLAGIKALRRAVVDPALEARGGRIVKLMGDGMLAELPSALEAVRAAMEIQQAMADTPSPAGITFRVGINLGDVVVEEGDIFGDGVNVAARLEAEARPGGLCISDMVHEQVRDRIKDGFDDLGALKLKNIDRPVRAWSWVPIADAPAPEAAAEEAAVTEKPSVAVLPFNVFGSNPNTEFLADGMVEDVITTLSKVPGLLVTARNSTFVYKGRAVDVPTVGRELGVRHVLEGGVRQVGSRVRVTAQLIDVGTGAHAWADTFDGSADDVFELIDDIARKILEALEVQLTTGEQVRVYLRGKWTIRAYENFQIGRQLYFRFTCRANAEARERFEASVRDCPNWASAHMMLAWTHADEARWGWTEDRDSALATAIAEIERGIELDPDSPNLWVGKAYTMMLGGEHDEAIKLARKAVALGPSAGDTLQGAAMVANYSGRAEDGLDYAKHTQRVTPVAQSNFLTELGHAHLLVGEPAKAIAPLRESLTLSPFWMSARCLLVWALDATGDAEGALSEAKALMEQAPRFRLSRWAPTQPYRDEAVLEAQLDALRRAGVPE